MAVAGVANASVRPQCAAAPLRSELRRNNEARPKMHRRSKRSYTKGHAKMSPSKASSARSRREISPSRSRRGVTPHGLTCALAALSFLSLPSCGASPEKGDDTDEANVAKASQEFKLMWPAALPRIQKFLAGNTLRVNLRGSDVTASNRASKQAILTQAIMAWVDAVRPVSRQPLITAADITWTSTNYDIDVNWAGESGRAMANCGVSGPAWMVLYHGDSFEVALHEFGQ